jgi:hypothetical protein
MTHVGIQEGASGLTFPERKHIASTSPPPPAGTGSLNAGRKEVHGKAPPFHIPFAELLKK